MAETMHQAVAKALLAHMGEMFGDAPLSWEDGDDEIRGAVLKMAGAVLAVVRTRLENPSREMLRDFLAAANSDDGPRRMSGSARELWQIMVAAAFAEDSRYA